MSRNVTGKTKLFGVIQTPIEHSCSPKMHNAAFDALGLDYEYGLSGEQETLRSGEAKKC